MPINGRSLARRWAPLLAALLFGVLAAGPLLANRGFLLTRGGGDSPFLLERLQQLLSGLQSGQFPVRWMPAADYGYGYPFFNYYAALPYYLAAGLKLYGFSFVTSLKLTQTAALLAASAGAYGWARSLPRPLGRAQAVLAAAAYTFAPFHLVNLYVRGDSLSELWAMALYPVCLWAAQRCLSRPSLGRVGALAGCTGLLVVTHNISALNFMPFLGLYLLLGGVPAEGRATPRGWRPLALAMLALGWGLALSAFFWLPALREIGAVQIADVTQGYFFYGNHFRAVDLVQPGLFFSLETGAGQPTPFSMSLAQAGGVLAGLLVMLAAALRARRWTRTDTFLIAGLALATFMITPVSAWVWARAPLLRFSQFPWRFLSIQALFAALIIARLAPGQAASRRGQAAAWALALGLGLALAVTTLGRLRPDFVPLSDADVTDQRLQLMEYFSANIGSTIGYEYLPRGVAARPFASDQLLERAPRIKTLSGAASGRQLWTNGTQQGWTIDASQGPAVVALPTHYWPGWTAQVDGQRVATRAAEGLGWVAFDVPAGQHSVTLALETTPLRAGAQAASLMALALPLALGVWRWRRAARLAAPAAPAQPAVGEWAGLLPVAGFGLAGVLMAASLLLHFHPPGSSDLPLSIDFDQLAVYFRDWVRFDGGTQLTGVHYSADHLARGAKLTVQTTWQAAAAGQARLSLVPASNLLDAAPFRLASAEAPLAAGTAASLTSALPIPRDIPPGVYFVTVEWSDAGGARAALTPAGRPRGLVHLAPVWIDDSGPALPAGAAPLARFGPAIELASAAATEPEPGVLQANLTWHALAEVTSSVDIGLRLRDAAGAEWAAEDTQLAYGYYPAALWRPGEVVPDFYRLRLPAGTPPGAYTLEMGLYAAGTRASLGRVTLNVALASATPRAGRATRFALTPELGLAGVEIAPQFDQGDAPDLRAGWLTGAAPSADLRARWTLVAADGKRTTFILDLAPGSPPSTWPAQAYILGRVRLGTAPDLAPGHYALTVQLVNAAGQPSGAETEVSRVEVLARPRRYDLPPVGTKTETNFGNVIELWGYDTQPSAGEMRLTLVWKALATTARDYKFFVHLFNPADGFVAAQFDAIPRDFTYPTALWVQGEVVSDTVRLALGEVPPGQYRLAVGWYDPLQPEQRLTARDTQGQPLPDGQVVLPVEVPVP